MQGTHVPEVCVPHSGGRASRRGSPLLGRAADRPTRPPGCDFREYFVDSCSSTRVVASTSNTNGKRGSRRAFSTGEGGGDQSNHGADVESSALAVPTQSGRGELLGGLWGFSMVRAGGLVLVLGGDLQCADEQGQSVRSGARVTFYASSLVAAVECFQQTQSE